MRVTASRTVRIGPGDRVTVRASLKREERLGRLYVWAKSRFDDQYSPYVANLEAVAPRGEPVMHRPISLRLSSVEPAKVVTFVSEVDGYLKVMQEVDTANDNVCKVRVSRTLNPSLNWKQKIARTLGGLWAWIR